MKLISAIVALIDQNHFNESSVLEFMRDAGALLSNLPALLVIVRSPTQVGKFASVFVQLLQKYLLNFYISICSTFTTVFVQHLHPYLSKPLIRFVISQLAQPSASKQLSDHPVSMGHLYVLTRLATPHVGKSTILLSLRDVF